MSLSTIHVDGIDFKDDQNKVWHYVGMTASALFKRWLMPSGPTALVEPNLRQWREMANEGGYDGEITLRVFRFAAPPNSRSRRRTSFRRATNLSRTGST